MLNCGGRTGNQLFQLSHAVSCRKRREWVISLGFGAALSLLAGPWKSKWINIDSRVLRFVVESFIYPAFHHAFVSTGIVSSHFERDSVCFSRQGHIRRITVMRGHFETHVHQAANLQDFFRLKPSLRFKVKSVLEMVPQESSPVFVHVRSSEREFHPPDEYYLKAIRLFRERYPDSFFIILSDDPDYADKIFLDMPRKFISRMSASEDLALMSLCDGGILCNSTFSWWGAFFGNRRSGYVVPKYWSGWAIKKWVPPNIFSEFMTYTIDV